jgi:carbon monoxide dehydrogenase subunit G
MDLAGEVAIPASRERVWQALNDPAVLRACIPGCEELVDESPTVRRARVLVKMGPVRARFDGRMTLSEVEAPQRCVLGFEGSGGAAGIASGRSQVELHEEGAATRITYAVKAAVGGKLGQIGGRMIDASARQLADQFFDALRRQLTPPEEPAAVAPSLAHPVASVPPVLALPPEPGDPVAAPATEVQRVLWFLLGVASTGFGVWLGKALF